MLSNKSLTEKFEFRTIHADEVEQAVAIEQICFPPHEACSEKAMKERIKKAPKYWTTFCRPIFLPKIPTLKPIDIPPKHMLLFVACS